MSDAWSDIQALKQRQTSLREKLKQRKQLVLGIQSDLDLSSAGSGTGLTDIPSDGSSEARQVLRHAESAVQQKRDIASTLSLDSKEGVETHLLKALCDVGISLPIDSVQLASIASKAMCSDVTKDTVENLLKKFAAQGVISLKEQSNDMTMDQLVVTTAEHSKLEAMVDTDSKPKEPDIEEPAEKRIKKDCEANVVNSKESVTEKSEKVSGKGKDAPEDILESLLSMRSAMEKETRKMGDEILDLLSKPTAKEKSLQEQFRSAGGAQVQEFCQHGTKQECMKENKTSKPCNKLHFCKIIHKHTDESLGDCSFLNTCFHMDSCKYVHYEVDYSGQNAERQDKRIVPTSALSKQLFGDAQLTPPQWIQCDVRCLDMSVLGKFSVVMADPPWDIHMELPYGTMSDDEMRHMDVQSLQDEGFIFLWVTGRAMELGRECLQLWGYDRCDEIIWVKTNQLQRIIRTGRTGHWINHGKEHCLVGIKGNPAGANRGLDCDVIVAEVRATSHKPDEIYGIIERLSPGTRKIELFGRMHNVQPNWITLGNQLDGTHIIDPEVADSFYKMYPEGIAMTRTQPH